MSAMPCLPVSASSRLFVHLSEVAEQQGVHASFEGQALLFWRDHTEEIRTRIFHSNTGTFFLYYGSFLVRVVRVVLAVVAAEFPRPPLSPSPPRSPILVLFL